MLKKFICIFLKHKLADAMYVTQKSCEQQQICVRCHDVFVIGKKHQWGKQKYLADDSCETHKEYMRCGTVNQLGQQHNWSKSEYTEENLCQIHQVCNRCNGSRNIGVKHQWGEWIKLSDDIGKRICYRCGTECTQTGGGSCHHVSQTDQFGTLSSPSCSYYDSSTEVSWEHGGIGGAGGCTRQPWIKCPHD